MDTFLTVKERSALWGFIHIQNVMWINDLNTESKYSVILNHKTNLKAQDTNSTGTPVKSTPIYSE
jgi:hypothetical protein